MTETPILLVGCAGILGGTFRRAWSNRSVAALGSADLDATRPDDVIRTVVALKPSVVVNCAADTNVEGAEDAPERAFAVNRTLAGALANAATECGAGFVHFSSTGCYGDWKDTPYVEADPLRPTTVHHRSKAEGEAVVLAAHPDALILRLGWVFGGVPAQKKNFVWARLKEARGKSEIGSNPKQLGTPTFADDVVRQTDLLIAGGHGGVYNCVGGGMGVSRLGYVEAIVNAAGFPCAIKPVDFPRRAPVSPNEMAVNLGLGAAGLDRMPAWRQSLAAFVQTLMGNLDD